MIIIYEKAALKVLPFRFYALKLAVRKKNMKKENVVAMILFRGDHYEICRYAYRLL